MSLPALHDVLATLDFAAKRLRLERGALPEPNGRDVLAIVGEDRGGRIDIPVDIGGVITSAVLYTRSFYLDHAAGFDAIDATVDRFASRDR